MKFIVLLPFITLFAGMVMTWQGAADEYVDTGFNRPTVEWVSDTTDTSEFDQQKALEMLRNEIEGMEDRPSEEVWQNIKMMKKVPAGRLLRIMEFGFTRSLGVDCTHCHNPENYADEDKPQKQIAREMMAMAGKINNELLAKIENLDSEDPTVNCTTCHRGEVKPALNLENR